VKECHVVQVIAFLVTIPTDGYLTLPSVNVSYQFYDEELQSKHNHARAPVTSPHSSILQRESFSADGGKGLAFPFPFSARSFGPLLPLVENLVGMGGEAYLTL
jgi:hypothetical protein